MLPPEIVNMIIYKHKGMQHSNAKLMTQYFKIIDRCRRRDENDCIKTIWLFKFLKIGNYAINGII